MYLYDASISTIMVNLYSLSVMPKLASSECSIHTIHHHTMQYYMRVSSTKIIHIIIRVRYYYKTLTEQNIISDKVSFIPMRILIDFRF